MKTLNIIYCAFFLNALAPLAQADTGRASAEFSDIAFSVIDLAPDDGVTASYSFLDGDAFSKLIFDDQTRGSAAGFLSSLSESDALHTGLILASGVKVSVQGQGTDYRRTAQAITGVEDLGNIYAGVTIRLAPKSLLKISTAMTLTAEKNCIPREGGDCNAASSAQLKIFSHATGTDSVYSSSVFSHFLGAYSPGMASLEKTGYVSYVNYSDQYKDLALTMKVEAGVSAYTLVPEPAANLLVGAGLAMVAVWGRSRSGHRNRT